MFVRAGALRMATRLQEAVYGVVRGNPNNLRWNLTSEVSATRVSVGPVGTKSGHAGDGRATIVASLEMQKGSYRIVFRYQGVKYHQSLQTGNQAEADEQKK
jgi:hypothetical protein